MEQVRGKQGEILLLNAGNMLFKGVHVRPGREASARVLASLMIDAYNVMALDALNIGAHDLSLGIDYLLEQSYRATFPFISANLRHHRGNLFFRPYVLREIRGLRVGILGLLDDQLRLARVPDSYKIKVGSPLRALRRYVPEILDRGADLVIVLTDMPQKACRKLARQPLPVHLIVSSSRRNQVSVPMVVDGTMIVHLDRGGKTVGRVDIVPKDAAPRAGGGTTVGRYLFKSSFIPLLLRIPEHPAVGPMVARALRQLSAEQRRAMDEEPAAPPSGCGQEYVGVEVCARCHPDRYAWWKSTAHARALSALEAKNRQYDPECLVCHTVAYECGHGTVSLETIEAFPNVQCESCHGPGSVHVMTEGREPVADGRVCRKCHTDDRSDTVDLALRVADICSGTLVE